MPRVHKSIGETEERLTETCRWVGGGCTYHVSLVSHEDGKVGQVTAGASGVALVGVQQLAALSGPVSHHAALRVIPEGTVGIVVMLLLQDTEVARWGE